MLPFEICAFDGIEKKRSSLQNGHEILCSNRFFPWKNKINLAKQLGSTPYSQNPQHFPITCITGSLHPGWVPRLKDFLGKQQWHLGRMRLLKSTCMNSKKVITGVFGKTDQRLTLRRIRTTYPFGLYSWRADQVNFSMCVCVCVCTCYVCLCVCVCTWIHL